MRTTFGLPLVCLIALVPLSATAQGLPTSQSNYLIIYREQVKPGKSAAHAVLEAGWPAAYAKAGGPQDNYLALNAMTGAPEVLFLQPVASFTAMGEAMKRTEGNAALSAELSRLSTADGEFLSGAQSLLLVARKDLSRGAYPDLARQRFWEVLTIRMKPGHEAAFEAAARAYTSAADRAGSPASFRVYQVMAGMQDATFMIFSSVASYGEFDAAMADGNKVWSGRSDGEKAIFTQYNEDVAFSATNRYQLDPQMSFVTPEVKATDPAFWAPKAPEKKKK
jgi:hypothetical protein